MAETATKPKPETKTETKPETRAVVRPYRIEPPVGWPVWWYPGGSRQRKPCAATPTLCAGRGVIGLKIIDGDFNEQRRRTVPWIGDPDIQFKPEFAAEQGAWDWIPGLVPPQYQGMAPEEPVILMLYKQHRKSIREISEYLGPDWSLPLVKAMLEKHNALDEQNLVSERAIDSIRSAQ